MSKKEKFIEMVEILLGIADEQDVKVNEEALEYFSILKAADVNNDKPKFTENGKLVLLTRDNIKGYIGKVVHKRTPLYCISDDICNICAGNRYHNIGVTEIGATSVALPNGLMNKGMKAFHDTKVKFHTVDLDKLIQ